MAVTANPLEVLLNRAPARKAEPPATARVVRSDTSGVWCAPVGGDTRHPIGPCRSATAVAVNELVLLVLTDDGPWALLPGSEGTGGTDPDVPDLTVIFENGLL